MRLALPPNASRRSGLVAEESTTPELVELARQGVDAFNHRGLDAAMRPPCSGQAELAQPSSGVYYVLRE
jgi:hypothetical protein